VELGNSAGTSAFWIALIAVPGKDLTQLENLCIQEIERVATEGVPPNDMERFRTDALRSRALGLVNTGWRADTLAQLFAAGLPPEALNQWEEGERRLSSEDLRRCAKQYLLAHRTILTIQPAEGAAR